MKRPPSIVVGALAVAALLAVVHALGGRESTAVLSGIAGRSYEPALALLYLSAWFFTVLVTPIVVLTWGLLALDRRLRPRRRAQAC